MALKIYNTLSRQIEEFVPIEKELVKIYSCGPTVYNYPHIGNYRAYLFADILRRTLQYLNYGVIHIMNITDVDDKTIHDSQSAQRELVDFTDFYTQEFFKDLDSLHILKATKYPKARDYINEMVSIITKLIDKGYAYKSDDGSVYFDIKKDKEYGKLAHLDMAKLKNNASGRIKTDEYEKDNIQDFALWKAWDESDGDVFWQTSLGKGRPGWHIECSAMSIENLGEHFDIHTGGRDNMFPHHENEIAQSECATGKKFVNYWLHNEWLLVDGKKMSKSAGNFYTLRDLIEKDFDPMAFRYLCMLTHYRTPINFTFESMSASTVAFDRLNKSFINLPDGGNVSSFYDNKFSNAISNDFNTPQALGIVWELIKDTEISTADKKSTLLKFDEVLGFGFSNIQKKDEEIFIPQQIKELLNLRNIAREEKDWVKSDELRAQILSLGYEIKDTESDTTIRKV